MLFYLFRYGLQIRAIGNVLIDYQKTIKNKKEIDEIDKFIEHLDEVADANYKYFDIVGASKIVYKELKELESIYMKGSQFDFEKTVKYLAEKERKEFEIFVQHDKILSSKGELFDTSKSFSIDARGRKAITNKAIYVMSENGEIYISIYSEYGKFHHSSFLSGNKVAAAGEIVIEKGIIKEITSNSGHYRPPINQVKKNMIKELDNRGYFSTGNNKQESIIFTPGF